MRMSPWTIGGFWYDKGDWLERRQNAASNYMRQKREAKGNKRM